MSKIQSDFKIDAIICTFKFQIIKKAWLLKLFQALFSVSKYLLQYYLFNVSPIATIYAQVINASGKVIKSNLLVH